MRRGDVDLLPSTGSPQQQQSRSNRPQALCSSDPMPAFFGAGCEVCCCSTHNKQLCGCASALLLAACGPCCGGGGRLTSAPRCTPARPPLSLRSPRGRPHAHPRSRSLTHTHTLTCIRFRHTHTHYTHTAQRRLFWFSLVGETIASTFC